MNPCTKTHVTPDPQTTGVVMHLDHETTGVILHPATGLLRNLDMGQNWSHV